ncbi:MAG: rhomboid family intramembrane serine protease [SAR324 cluster bacterium]|nr:rhomboid family intramembrane serine protease [SAR324 cluster bacterium]
MSEHAIICPSCKQLINRSTIRCPNCGWSNNKLSRLVYSFGEHTIVKWLISLNIFFFLVSIILSYIFAKSGFISKLGILSPSSPILLVMGWADPYEALNGSYWQLLSSIFLHGGFFHILFNMMWLYHLYPQNESLLGKHNTFFIYIFCGIGGSVLAALLGSSPVVGASGAIFGLMGSLVGAARYSNDWAIKFFSSRYTTLMIILLIIGFIMPGISNLSHLGGAGTGYILGSWLARVNLAKKYQVFLVWLSVGLTATSLFFIFKRILTILFF